MKQGGSGRFRELDVLRGLAALCVVVSHYTSHSVRFFGESPFHIPTIYGFYAVQLFFVISGFVIYFTLEHCDNWRDFAFSRMTRLYPTYWAVIALVTVIGVTIFGNDFWLGGLVTNMTMMQEYLGYPNLDVIYWSLTVEVTFYAGMAIILACGLLGRIEIVSIIWLALAFIWALLEKYLGVGVPAIVPRALILPQVPFFVAGIMFYLIYAKGVTATRVFIVFGALAIQGWMQGWVGLGVAAIIFGIFILAMNGRLRLTISPVTLWLGAISYPLYLSHRNLGYLTLDWLHAAGVSTNLALALVFAGALALASCLTYLVEQPSLRFLRGWYRSKIGRPKTSPILLKPYQ